MLWNWPEVPFVNGSVSLRLGSSNPDSWVSWISRVRQSIRCGCAVALYFMLPDWKIAWRALNAFFWPGASLAPNTFHAWGLIAVAWMLAANLIVDWLLIYMAIVFINLIRGRSRPGAP